MGQSAEELREQIVATREDLGGTVDAIGDHVSPSRVVQRRKDRLAARWSSAKESVMGTTSNVGASLRSAIDTVTHAPATALNNGTQGAVAQTQGQPIVAGALAFGVGFLIASAFPGSRTEGQVARKVQELAQPAVDELKQAGQEAVGALKEPTLEGVNQVKEAAMSGTDEVRSTAQEAIADTKDAVGLANQQVSDHAKNAVDNVREA
jgi:hypothetical protein